MAFLLRMTWLAAGVDRMPFWPTSSFLTPYAAPIFAINWTTSGFQYRPSPPTTRNEPVLCVSRVVVGVAAGKGGRSSLPSTPSGIDRRMLVTKDSL